MSFRALFRSRAALTLWLVAALLWTPIWGQSHGIAHPVQQSVLAAAPTASPSPDHPHDGHASGSALCLVLDHLAQASALGSWPVLAPALVWPLALPVLAPGMAVASRACRPPQARAPPRWI